ncbi:uncharacterized protein LOC128265312 [Drosophila gunungcola]|uniref:uncharacterized protein LOC128265312 n=1 Tax=Drosophila gunungcola TaxID=103775 RepID=UPI0022E0C848|nr:uncharacterized protein LOC128265312 [Drosophila gunungcola]
MFAPKKVMFACKHLYSSQKKTLSLYNIYGSTPKTPYVRPIDVRAQEGCTACQMEMRAIWINASTNLLENTCLYNIYWSTPKSPSVRPIDVRAQEGDVCMQTFVQLSKKNFESVQHIWVNPQDPICPPHRCSRPRRLHRLSDGNASDLDKCFNQFTGKYVSVQHILVNPQEPECPPHRCSRPRR